jgi:hypothetical protein
MPFLVLWYLLIWVELPLFYLFIYLFIYLFWWDRCLNWGLVCLLGRCSATWDTSPALNCHCFNDSFGGLQKRSAFCFYMFFFFWGLNSGPCACTQALCHLCHSSSWMLFLYLHLNHVFRNDYLDMCVYFKICIF